VIAGAAGALLLAGLVAVSWRREDRPAPSPGPEAASAARAAGRRLTALDGPWRFTAEGPADEAGAAPGHDDAAWTEVNLPHTWGREPRRHAWYRLRLDLQPPAGRRLYVAFDGAASIADVFLNGTRVGGHNGAYTRFVLDVTEQARPGPNVLAVRLTNHPQDTVDSLPSGASKTLYWPYGGLYRKVWLLETAGVHVDPADHGSPGVFLTATNVTAEGADLAVRTVLRNAGAAAADLEVRHRLLDPDGREVQVLEARTRLEPGGRGGTTATAHVEKPRLWAPGHPSLYTVATELLSGGQVVDEVRERTGFRSIRMEDGAFVLNGQKVLLRGVGKHQEVEDRLVAMTEQDMEQDFDDLVDLGANVVRLAHYPHARREYELADERGILVWAENGHSNPWKVGPVADVITREMVLQHYNHPSVVMWSVGNENGYVRVPGLAAVVRALDTTRLVTYASNTGLRAGKRYKDLDFVAHNTYRGWYRGQPWDFEQKALGFRYIAESGAGAVVTNHAEYATARHVLDKFEPEEYRQQVAEVHFQNVFRDHPDEIPLYLVWILRDFSIEKYKHRWNTKGLVTYSRFRKDAFYLYQSFLRPDHPVLHVTSRTWFHRAVRDDNGVKVYSNAPRVRLLVNGEDHGWRDNGHYGHRNGRRIANTFMWDARLRPGRNEIEAVDDAGRRDTAVVYQAGAAPPDPADPIRELRSSSGPAVFIRQPARAQWPFYLEFDASADNTFDVLPPSLEGVQGWVATRRLSKPEARTAISFTVSDTPRRVLVAVAEGAAAPFEAAGFTDTGERGRWRTNDLDLQAFRVLGRDAAAGEQVRVPAATADYVVLVK
jgi:beta-galactosidase